MPRSVDPATLEGQPLILKATRPGGYSVQVLELSVGSISTKMVSGSRTVWFWSISGPYLPPHLQPSNGDADSLDEAKEAFRKKFDAWLAWASTLQHPAAWHPGSSRIEE